MRRLLIAAAGAVALVPLGACGIPTDDGTFNAIAPEEVPFRLNEVATTTTTTTTTTLPAAVPETTEEATTTTVAPTEPVEIYFLSRDDLLPVVIQFPSPYSRNELISQLEAGPPQGPAAELGLQTLIEPGLIVETSAAEGVATVFLDEDVFGEIDARDQTRAIGQIVLTFTANLRGIGQVAFMLADEPLRVRMGNGLLADEGEAVSFDDYHVLIADTLDTPDATTTTEGSAPSDTTGDTDPADQ